MNKNLPKIFLLFFILLSILPGSLFSGGRPEINNTLPHISLSEENTQPQAETIISQPTPVVPDRGEVVLRAFLEAYPDRIRAVEFYDGDWTIIVYNERFFWAEGRLLPESLRHRFNDFSVIPMYNYPENLPPFEIAVGEENERLREQEARRRDSSIPSISRSPHFLDALWRTRNQHEAWVNVKSIRFLGTTIMVHYSILTQLSLVEQQILRLANSSTEVRRWIDSLQIFEGWVWRDIAETENRSYHSYGAAIDIMPRNLGNLQTYWLWSTQYYPEWWNIPYTRRYHPPESVVRIFESFGFVWGGKWRRFDTMHFEYRPEIMILNGIPLMNLLDLN